MTKTDAAALLAVLAAYSRRTTSETDVLVWAQALDDIRLTDAVEAVHAHHRTSSEWLDPARVRRLVAALRGERLARIPVPPPPADIADDPHRALDWHRRWITAIGDGLVEPEDATAGLPARDMSFLAGAFRRVPELEGRR